jgi:hypothetical protein
MNVLQSAGKWLRRIFGGPPAPVGLRTDERARLLEMARATCEDELDCEEAHALIDQFADRVARGENAADLMPLVQEHLDMCPGCKEEYETLLRMMGGSENVKSET